MNNFYYGERVGVNIKANPLKVRFAIGDSVGVSFYRQGVRDKVI